MARLAKFYVVLNIFLMNLASAQSPTGGLRGTVQDSQGRRVASASITIRSLSSTQRRIAACDGRGEFRFDALTPGAWLLTASSPGFAVPEAQVLVAVSAVRDVVITMKPASDSQTAHISARASSITTQPMDAASQVHQGIVTRQDLETIPLAGRSFANIAYLAPGTEPVEPSDPTKARITAVSTGGSSGLNNELSVDGADNSDDYIGGFLQNFSPDVIQEFAVRTAQQDADTGATTAGSVVITTRSGSNAWHAEAAIYERAAALNARFPIENPEPNPKQPFSRQNYVGTLGGALIKSRLWSFTSYEQVHENASIAYSPASLNQFDALADLASRGLIPGLNSIPVPRVVPVPFRDFLSSQRLDWAESSRSSWFLRGAVDSYTTHNNLVAQGSLPSTGLLTHNNYLNLVAGNQYLFSPAWLGQFLLSAGGLHLTQSRNSDYGFALAFPFSSTALTISGFETFGDNQFATPITFFPSRRNQEKYQLRADINGELPGHALKIGANLIHEPVLGGSFPGNPEFLYSLPQNPTYYLEHPSEFSTDLTEGASETTLGGGFAQNIQRLAIYAQDSWRLSPRITLNYGLRWSGTWGLFMASGRSQAQNAGYVTLRALQIPLVPGVPHDQRRQFGPRLGLVWSLGGHANTVLRAGFGLFHNDLAQTGWVAALKSVNSVQPPCANPLVDPDGPENSGCVPGSLSGGTAEVIDGGYRTPYALHASAGFEHAFSDHWLIGADYTHEQGVHGYRAYGYTGGGNLFTPLLPIDDPSQAAYVPDVNVFHSDNRSSYDALMIHVQGNWTRRIGLTANYALAKAQTWGCVLGELSDYVNGVCNPLDAFAPGDYGSSREDNRHRAVIAIRWHAPGRVEFSGLTQAESPRPFTITNADESSRIAINGVPTSLDQFRGTAYIQSDLRISRPIAIGERLVVTPFAEAFNIFNRNNPGANFITNVAALPVPPEEASSGNIDHVCLDRDCNSMEPIRSRKQLEIPAGAFGDFFGPGTTVGMPFALQIGFRASF